jgi:hypothetical protein
MGAVASVTLVMSTAPASREVSAVILDASAAMKDHLGVAKGVCSALIQQKFVFSPKDLVGIVVGGTATTANRLNAAAAATYKNIAVVRPVMAPNADFLKAIDSDTCDSTGANFDLLDNVVVAADALHEAVGDKKFNRRIFLVSSCAGDVQRKDQLAAIIDGLKARGIALVVIGVNFADPDDAAAAGGNDWATLTVKQQNEKVLHFMCGQLGTDSLVIAVHDAVSALSALRKKHLAQRVYCRVVLDIGDVRIPVALYVKCLEQRIPSFGKVTAKGSEALTMQRRYFSVRRPDVELDAHDRVKAYRYGRSAIPVNEVDQAQMKFKSDRTMSALGFVHADQVPLHILQGGSKLITPMQGDSIGAGAFASFVRAMHQLKRAMIVRFVRCTNANPAIGVCYPSVKDGKDALYYAALPYAEDLRRYTFRSLGDVQGTPDEQKAVAAMIDGMDLDKLASGTLPPFVDTAAAAAAGAASASTPPHVSPAPAKPASGSGGHADTGDSAYTDASDGGGTGSDVRPLSIKDTFNPALQHYYHAVKERYLRPEAPVAGLPPQVARTSTNWNDAHSVLAPMLQPSVPLRKRVREMLPPPPPKTADAAKGAKAFWFHKVADVHLSEGGPAKAHRPEAGPAHYLASGTPAATTTGAGTTPSHHITGTPTTPVTAAEVDNALRVGADLPDGKAMHVTTVDPVGTFLALVDVKGEDHVARAIHEMQEAILHLLKVSIGPQYYSRCGEAVRALRRICIREAEPAAFNVFLVHLMLTTRHDAHSGFWGDEIVKAGVLPISKRECGESDLSEEAARTFLDERAPQHRVVLDDVAEEPSLFDELE